MRSTANKPQPTQNIALPGVRVAQFGEVTTYNHYHSRPFHGIDFAALHAECAAVRAECARIRLACQASRSGPPQQLQATDQRQRTQGVRIVQFGEVTNHYHHRTFYGSVSDNIAALRAECASNRQAIEASRARIEASRSSPPQQLQATDQRQRTQGVQTINLVESEASSLQSVSAESEASTPQSPPAESEASTEPQTFSQTLVATNSSRPQSVSAESEPSAEPQQDSWQLVTIEALERAEKESGFCIDEHIKSRGGLLSADEQTLAKRRFLMARQVLQVKEIAFGETGV